MEFGCVIDMRKRLVLWNGGTQEGAEWLPSLLDIKDQQPMRGNRLAHRAHVPGKDGLAMCPIGETMAERAVENDVPRSRWQLVVQQGENRALDAVVPALRIAHGENDFGFRVRSSQLFPEIRPWPIDDR